MKNLLALICLVSVIFLTAGCDPINGPTRASTVEFKFAREVENASDTNPLNIAFATGGGCFVNVWRRIGSNEWIGEKYLDYSYGSEYYVYDVDLACDGFCRKGRIIFARDKDKGQDWIELTDVLPNLLGNGDMARFRLGERGVYF
jgi:hypothetical protein